MGLVQKAWLDLAGLKFRCSILLFVGLLSQSAFGDCSKIVSLAPSITETLFEVGLGPEVVGVTRYDKYPQAVESISKIGGFLDPNLEAIVSIGPTLTVGLKEQQDVIDNIAKLGLKTLVVNHQTVSGILASITELGRVCQRAGRAHSVRDRLETEVSQITQSLKNVAPVRVMIVIGGNEEGVLKNLFISGQDGYFSEILHLAKGENVYQGKTITMPGLSLEGVLSLDPEIIIEITSDIGVGVVDKNKALAAWQTMPDIKAVKNSKVFIVDDNYFSIPGPRFILVLRKFCELLHPGVVQ